MAELVGLIASITGIAAAGAKLSVQLYDLTSQVGSARQDVADVGQDISVFTAVLGHIAATLEKPSIVRFNEGGVRTASWITTRAEAIFKELEEVINGIVPAAETTQQSKSTSMGVARRVKWLFKRQRVVQLRATLESMKLTLQLMLTTMELSGKMQSRRHSVASAATAAQVEDTEIAVAESLVIAHQLSVERLRVIEDKAEEEDNEDPDTATSSAQPSASFTIDPARNSGTTGPTSDLTPEGHADEGTRKGKGNGTPRDSTVLGGSCITTRRREFRTPVDRKSLASDPFPARTATPGASNRQPTENPSSKPKTPFPHAFERWEALSAHWEGITSFWIQRLQENTGNLDQNPSSSQPLSQQINDLAGAGASLFNAVREMQRLRASSERKFQRWFFETRSELERNQETIANLQIEIEETRSRLGEEITRERELADEALQIRVQLQRDLDRASSRFAEERKIRARLQDDLQKELGRLAAERRSKHDLQVELEEERLRYVAGVSDAAAKLEAEKKNKEALRAELDQEKERRKKAIQFLTGESGELRPDLASPGSVGSTSDADTSRSQQPMTPPSATSGSP